MKQDYIEVVLNNKLKGFIKKESVTIFFEDPDDKNGHTKIGHGYGEYTVVKGTVNEIFNKMNDLI